MKKFIFTIVLNIFVVFTAVAEIYHGIDIDDVYKKVIGKLKTI